MNDLGSDALIDKTLDKILKDTIEAMETSKTQIFDIYEGARTEAGNIKIDIEQIKVKVSEIILRVDTLERQERDARQTLVKVSSDFRLYTETDIKVCYDHAKNIQIELAVVREQEQNLRHQRDDLEMRLKQLQGTVDKAKQLVAQVGVVLGYLSAQMGAVVNQMEAVTQDKLFGAQIIKAQEAERLRVSREIHDGPAQLMANVIYRASVCERLIELDKEKAKLELQELREQMRGCLGETRKIIFDLRPMTLDDLGLVATIHHFLKKFKTRMGIEVSFEIVGQACTIDKHIEISLFRIMQEALNNIHKHAETQQARLVLKYNAEYISLFIEDEGVGFFMDDLKTAEGKSDCYGLIGMQERVKLLNGQLLVDSIPGRGTKLRVLIPVEIKDSIEEK